MKCHFCNKKAVESVKIAANQERLKQHGYPEILDVCSIHSKILDRIAENAKALGRDNGENVRLTPDEAKTHNIINS